MMVVRSILQRVLACGWMILVGAGAQAQTPAAAAGLQASCAALLEASTDARELALRAQCVLMRLLPSEQRFADARAFARQSMQLGDPAGGFMLYTAFSADPENSYLIGGRTDAEAYKRLAARPLERRGEQVEALDALAFAASKGHVNAATTLALYFFETSAPRNVERARNLTALLLRSGERGPILEGIAQQSELVNRLAPDTKASTRAFIDAYRTAGAAALVEYKRNGGGTCDKLALKSARAGEIEHAQYLPLNFRSVQSTYLVKGSWTETWMFSVCEQEIPIDVRFQADGWGGATFAAAVQQHS